MSPLTQIVTLAFLAVLTFQAVNAQGPSDGKYSIVSTTRPQIPVGVDDYGPYHRVAVGGKSNVWTIMKLDEGDYQIILEQSGIKWYTEDFQGTLTMSPNSPAKPRGTWRLQKYGDYYSIEVPSNIVPSKAWALKNMDNTQPGEEVTIGAADFPMVWKFTPVLEK
ncbi:hypothetical protein BGZ95_006582 [Linnemannia exigua]|uniref:Uncharacterized protein n=1 Tax=Linnemannia exigua TaxID=604196 RepID=A0AAD4H214_9FUNG|nr:hypothetical protein BGZ95_006582 [Linnemannia exigua]